MIGRTREFQDCYFPFETARFRGALQSTHAMTRNPIFRIFAGHALGEGTRRKGPLASRGPGITAIPSSAGTRTWSSKIAPIRVGVDARNVARGALRLMLIQHFCLVVRTTRLINITDINLTVSIT